MFSLFLILTAIIATPGPNNTILLLSGAKNGFFKTMPALTAINVGVCAVFLVCGLLVGSVVQYLPVIRPTIQVAGVVMLMYVAWSMWPKAKAAGPSKPAEEKKSVLNLFVFQFLNPKIWAAVISVITSFASEMPLPSILLMTLLVGYVFNSCWILAGCVIHAKFDDKYNRQMDQLGSIMVLACIAFLFI
jgi:threonine/homoserine/homoserine lactone efflux protein